ncbi:alpha/beta hydrolase [Streptomyces bohaiensis]|uniref:alpha/beta hydrolase n=1 Tax=Streptomyces bohaiensis TaxID=1431344 RepID=UPI003B7E3A66
MSDDATDLAFHPLPPGAPRSGAAAPGVIVMPGGGYTHLAPHEGAPVAAWLGRLGFAAWVLEYPVGPAARHPAPLDAARAAMRRARADAPGLGVDPARIGVLGFSAGGHLAAHLAAGPATEEAERPAFAVLCYPATSWHSFAGGDGSPRADPLLGPDTTDARRRELSIELIAVERTPPTFLWHCADDPVVGVDHALSLTRTLAGLGVPVELHVYPEGGHGIGLAADSGAAAGWTARCAEWLARTAGT